MQNLRALAVHCVYYIGLRLLLSCLQLFKYRLAEEGEKTQNGGREISLVFFFLL